MAQPTSEELDKALRDSGYTKDPNDSYYSRPNDRGGRDKIWGDGDYTQTSGNNYGYVKHRDGDQY